MALDTSVSILGSSYFQPIADLIERWTANPRRRPNKVGSGYAEHGYAAATLLLLVAMFESYMVRVRYITGKHVPNDVRAAIDVLRLLYPAYRGFGALTDVYVLRDAIFHNHLWEIEYSWGGSASQVLHGAVLHPAFGDKKYKARVNPQTRRTKALGLSIVPTRVSRRDVKKTFLTIWKTLLFLEGKNRNQCYVSHLRVRFQKQRVLFNELANAL
jgi:hypothetical protein